MVAHSRTRGRRAADRGRIVPAIEIACDESGAEGEKLANGETRLFTHAGVAVPTADAVDCVAELRVRIGSPARTYKANHLLREKHRRTLEWFLGPDGPISGRARVVLVDKERFLFGTFLGLLANPDMPGWLAAPTPGWLATPGPTGPTGGTTTNDANAGSTTLDAVNELLRGRLDHDEFRRRAPDWLAGHDDAVRAIAVRQSRRSPDRVVLDPLFWAITRVADVWGGPVAVVHDRHLSLTPSRVAALVAAGGLARFDIASAGLDARVQLADFLAGIVRRTCTAALAGAEDRLLLDLVRPYLAAPQ